MVSQRLMSPPSVAEKFIVIENIRISFLSRILGDLATFRPFAKALKKARSVDLVIWGSRSKNGFRIWLITHDLNLAYT